MKSSTTWRDDAQRLASMEGEYGFLPIRPKSKAPLIQWRNHVGLTIAECLSIPNCSAISVITGFGLLCLDYDGESSLDYAAEQGIDFTARSWHARRDDNHWRFKVLFRPTPEQIAQLPKGEFIAKHITKKSIDGAKGEALECFLDRGRYAIVIGKHQEGGNYIWPPDFGPEALVTPTQEVWKWVLKMAELKKEPLKKSVHRFTKTTRLKPCPICGRDSDLWCETDGTLIFCMPGTTFNAEDKHGALSVGDVVDGYALVKRTPIGSGDCLTFTKHKPVRRPKRPCRPQRRSENV